MLTAHIDKTSAFLVRVPALAGEIRKNVVQTTYRLAIGLQRYIVMNKLSGQVLNKRTGNLQQSIHQEVIESAQEVRANVFSAGDVKYAAIHEYGGTIRHPGGTAYMFVDDKNSGGFPVAFISNKKAAELPAILGRTKPHNIVMPERSFMRTGLQDKRPEIIESYHNAVTGVLK